MNIKQFTLILTAIAFSVALTGQNETYTIRVAKFSSAKSDELAPVYYKNGLVFCSNGSRNLLMNYSTSENKGLLKICFVDTASLKVSLFSKDLKTKFNDGPASFSKSLDTIYFSRNQKVDGDIAEDSPRNKLGIFSSVNENGKWIKILDIRFNTEYYNITTPCISADGKRLFFASDNPAGFGGTDLYYCDWKNDYWGDPINMGPTINTPGNESYPFVNREGGVFFSSDGHPGLGGKDIFYTKQIGDKWLTPVRLDAPINSKYDDFSLIADSVMRKGYFASKRGSTVDIYEFMTNYYQLFYCDNQRVNQYCFKFSDKGKITVDTRYIQLLWKFGDGATAIGQSVEHCFKGPGKYSVRLDAVDKKSGKVFFTKLFYDIDLKDIEQPVISAPSSAMVGDPVGLDGLLSNFPGSDILDYTWYFGDGDRTAGQKVNHTFFDKGRYDVKLGLMIRNRNTGIIQQACSIKQIEVFGDKMEKTIYDKREIKPDPPMNIMDYDFAKKTNFYSADNYINQDAVFRVEIASSRLQLSPDNEIFKNIPKKYTIKEEFLPSQKVYSYFIDEELSLMATYPAFNEITASAYPNARIYTYNVEDPASKELNNIKRIFGVATDKFFRKNAPSLTSEGTQVLDLILGFLSKYPNIKLDIICHTDNFDQTAASNLSLSQKRADAMIDYLVVNGIERTRLNGKGYGGTRPVAPNYQESDRLLNRRIDFSIAENKP